MRARKSSPAEDELLEELLWDELERMDDLELLVAGAQFTPNLVATLVIALVLRLMVILVQPDAAISLAGNASAPQPPFGSTLKRGLGVVELTIKLRQMSDALAEPVTGVNKSPSTQPLCVPRRWYLVPVELEAVVPEGADELDFDELDLDELDLDKLDLDELGLDELDLDETELDLATLDNVEARVILQFLVSVKNLIFQVPTATGMLVPPSPPTP